LLVNKSTSVFKVVKREVAVLKAMERKFSLILRHHDLEKLQVEWANYPQGCR
jgi:hypothetical protein